MSFIRLLETADKAMSDTAKPLHYWARSVCNQLRGVCTPESPLQKLFRSYAKIPNFKNFANRRLRATIKKKSQKNLPKPRLWTWLLMSIKRFLPFKTSKFKATELRHVTEFWL